MATLKPFEGIRPRADMASRIAALPYDVYTREEARREVTANPSSFLKIDRAETQFPSSVDMYSDEVYDRARQTLESMIQEGDFVQDREPMFYIYELTMNGRSQTGLVGCASIDDYLDGTIKKHENTREDKAEDRIHHVDVCNAQTGPIFLAYRKNDAVNTIVGAHKKEKALYDFTSEDGIRHRVWRIFDAASIRRLIELFEQIGAVYIADGHHRAASAVKVGQMRRAERPDYSGMEEYNFFLSVLFPDEELLIMDYNRVITDLNGMDGEELLEAIQNVCSIEGMGNEPVKPEEKGTYGMYLDGIWYRIRILENLRSEDVVEGLDVSLLQNHILYPILGIEDPRTDARIKFIGGIRGLESLEKEVDENGGVAFAMYPTSMAELFAVADEGKLMPPKSTWFEPKLRSGLFIHSLD